MKPGVYFDMPEDEYSAAPGLRSTFLRSMLQTTPAKAKEMEESGGKQSDALAFGRLVHLCVLEPKRAAEALITEPEFEGKGSRAMRSEWLVRHAGKVPVKAKVQVQLAAMCDAIQAHPEARKIFDAPGRSEVSAFWADPLGFDAKSRIDRIYRRGESLAIAELKSTRNAEEGFFRYDCDQYGYYVEAAMQLRALDICQGEHVRPYHFVAVEKTPPYRVEVHELRRIDRSLGKDVMIIGMRAYADAIRTGEWPDYPITLRGAA
jgi:hypothetical protein